MAALYRESPLARGRCPIKLFSSIGKGGQAEVWRGVSENGDPIAVKILHQDGQVEAAEHRMARFKREIASQQSLDHPNIVKILSFDLDAEPPYYTMPLALGSLEQRVRELDKARRSGADTPEPEDLSEVLLVPIVNALAFAHERGVIHRDLTPSNVLIFEGDIPGISDFGLSKDLSTTDASLTKTGIGMGTDAYMAPEQRLNGKLADARSDVFSMGWIIYNVLVGRHESFTPNFDNIPPNFRYLISTSVADKADDRFPSAVELSVELSTAIAASRLPAASLVDLSKNIANGDVNTRHEFVRALLALNSTGELAVAIASIDPDATAILSEEPSLGEIAKRVHESVHAGDLDEVWAARLAFALRDIVRGLASTGRNAAAVQDLLNTGFDLAAQTDSEYVFDRLREMVKASMVTQLEPFLATAFRHRRADRDLTRRAIADLNDFPRRLLPPEFSG